ERVAREQILSLGAKRRALERRRIEHVPDLDDAVLRADFHQREIAKGLARCVSDCIRIGVRGCGAFGDEGAKRRLVLERPVGRDVGPYRRMAGKGPPQVGSMPRLKLFHAAVAALQHDRSGPAGRRRIDRQPDRLACLRVWLRIQRAVPKNLLRSALETIPAKLSNLPSLAISVADLMNAFMATRDSVPPTLMRRTPISAMSFTVKPRLLWFRKLTGLGATACTTATICSRARMPGA